MLSSLFDSPDFKNIPKIGAAEHVPSIQWLNLWMSPEKNLVKRSPLNNDGIKVSWDLTTFPSEWKNKKKCSKPPTSICLIDP